MATVFKKDDLAEWYQQLKQAKTVCDATNKNDSVEDREKALRQMRGLLIAPVQEERVAEYRIWVPYGVSVYPHNTSCALWGTTSAILLLFFGGCLAVKYRD